MNRHDRRRLRDAPEIRVEVLDKNTGALMDSLSVKPDRVDDDGMVVYVARATGRPDLVELHVDVLPPRSSVQVEFVSD